MGARMKLATSVLLLACTAFAILLGCARLAPPAPSYVELDGALYEALPDGGVDATRRVGGGGPVQGYPAQYLRAPDAGGGTFGLGILAYSREAGSAFYQGANLIPEQALLNCPYNGQVLSRNGAPGSTPVTCNSVQLGSSYAVSGLLSPANVAEGACTSGQFVSVTSDGGTFLDCVSGSGDIQGDVGIPGKTKVIGAQYGAVNWTSTGLQACSQGATFCGLTQPSAATGATPQAMTISSQAPYAYSSGSPTAAQQTPGPVVINLPAPSTYGGTPGVETMLTVERGGSVRIGMGELPGGSGYGTLWFGSTPVGAPTTSNYTILGDPTGQYTEFNSSANVWFKIANTTQLALTASGLQLFNGGTMDLGGGTGVVGLTKAATNPTATSTGSVVYADHTSGDLAIKPPSSTAATVDFGATVTTMTVPLVETLWSGTVVCGGTVSLSAAQSAAGLFWVTGCTSGTGATIIKSALPPTSGTHVDVRNGSGYGITWEWSSGAATTTIATTTSARVLANGTNAAIIMAGT